MTFRLAALEPDVGLRFAVQIQGIPYVFLDGPAPVGPDGTQWAAPTSGAHSYTYQQHCLDIDAAPLRDPGALITRSKADVSSAGLALVLRDDALDTLLGLFARQRSDGYVANLTDDVDYDTGATGLVTLTVDSTTGWPSEGYVYFGRETCYYNSVSPTSLAGARDLFNSLGYGDTHYVQNTARPGAPRVVSSYPRVWQGRYVRVFAWCVSASGHAYDSAWGGTYSQEIWRGTIEGNPVPARDGLSWEIRTVSIEAILGTSVGRETTRASLLRAVGSAEANVAGAPPVGGLVYYTDEANRVHFTVQEWATRADYESAVAATATPVATYDHTAGVALGLNVPIVGTMASLENGWAAINNTILADTGDDLSVKLIVKSNGRIQLYLFSAAGKYYRLEVQWSAPSSVGALLGLTTTAVYDTFSGNGVWTNGTFNIDVAAHAIYIGPAATTIPFFYDPDEGAAGALAAAPASGYARIGEEDEAEIVSYAAISAVDDEQLDGCYVMTGCKRGRFGTAPRTWSLDLAAADVGETAHITFGVGWENTSAIDILLQLATSTGGGHHGDYDYLPAGTGTPLNPAHFDTTALERLSDNMAPLERQVSWFLAKPEKLSELISSWLQPQGRYLHACTLDDGTYRITPGHVLPPLESASAATLDASQVDWRDPTVFRPGSAEVVNEVKALYRYDFRKDDFVEGAFVVVIDQDSAEEYGRRAGVEWKLRGAIITPEQARILVTSWAQDIFRRYGRPYELLRLQAGRVGWFLRPGATVTLDLAHLPNGEGSRGLDMLATVLQVEKSYSGESIGSVVDLVLESPERTTTYAPCARPTAYDAGGPTLTLQASAFGSVDGRNDAEYFDAGDKVWVYQDEADVSTRVQRTIVSRSGSVLTLSSALSGGWTAGGRSLVVAQDYADAVAAQRHDAFIAGNTNVLATAPTEAFRYA